MKISKWEETLPIGDAQETIEKMRCLYEEELEKLLPRDADIDVSDGDVGKIYITDTHGNIYRITDDYSGLSRDESDDVDQICQAAWSNALDRLCNGWKGA